MRLKQILNGAGTVQGKVQEVDVEGEGRQIWFTFVVVVQESDARCRDEKIKSNEGRLLKIWRFICVCYIYFLYIIFFVDQFLIALV